MSSRMPFGEGTSPQQQSMVKFFLFLSNKQHDLICLQTLDTENVFRRQSDSSCSNVIALGSKIKAVARIPNFWAQNGRVLIEKYEKWQKMQFEKFLQQKVEN